jgi:hypothetical protein
VRSLFIVLALGCACVFPADEPTGVELSWRFFEVNAMDGEEGIRIRSCAGAGFDRIVFDIVQVDDQRRSGNFDYPCEVGFQTPSEFRTEASDAFVELRPADYALTVNGVSGDRQQLFTELEIDVLARGLTIEGLELTLATATWTLQLVNTDMCTELGMALHYRAGGDALAEPMFGAEGEPLDVPYRSTLTSDRGLVIGGPFGACTAELAGDHVFELVDQGPYRLLVVKDGVNCSANIDITPGATTSVVDLANLACDG